MHVLSRSSTALAVLAVVGSCGVAAAPAAVSPTAAQSGTELDVRGFGVAMTPAGIRSALVYEGSVRGSNGRRLALRARLGRGRAFNASQRLEDLRAGNGARAQVRISSLRVAVGPDRTAVAAWIVTTATRDFGRQRHSLRVARATDGKRFGRPQTIVANSPTSFEISALVAGRDGRTVLLLLGNERVEVLLRRGAGRFAARRRLGTNAVYQAPPSLALAPSGAVVAAWSPAFGSTAQAAVLSAGGRRFGAAQTVSSPGERASFVRAVGGPGGPAVAWTTATDPESTGRLRLARFSRGGAAVAAPVTLADAASGAPHVAIPLAGVATAWRNYSTRTEAGDNDHLVDSRLTATATWIGAGAVRPLTVLPALALRPVVAAIHDRALIAWRELPAYALGTRVRLAVAGPDGWLPTVTVASDTFGEVQTSPATGIVEDERPLIGDMAIAAGHESALLAWRSLVRVNGETIARLRVASYRP